MPRILARDPVWLSRSAPGFSLFQPEPEGKSKVVPENEHDGPLRKIAHRGTEIFVAVGKELRWSDLGLLKDAGEELGRHHGRRTEDQLEDGRGYRILKTPVSRPITQLSVSPSGDYIAILTSHTCHVCILPSLSHLHQQENSPLRLKTFQIGPTAHVLEQAPLVSAIWHPLSPTGNGLVTTTHDACVRLWELDSENRSTFDEPALAVDLKKLANATSSQADLSASKYGANKGFSPDDVEMQVAAACFGGQAREDEHGWASMTLWVAMTEGDVYALCPFLPSKWAAPASLLPSLSTSVIERSRALNLDSDVSESERRTVDQQCKWLAEVDAHEPLLCDGYGESGGIEIHTRPSVLSSVPKLQGPFQLSPEPEFGEITDIHVIAPKIDDAALYDDFDNDEEPQEGLSVSIICLATTTNEVHICLDVSGVEAEWLPSKRSRSFTYDDADDDKELVLLETIDLAGSEAEDDGWPTFTPSPIDRYEIFATHPNGVCGLSFRPWIGMLEEELSTPSDSGADLRLGVLLDSASTLVDQPIELSSEPDRDINVAIAILDPSIGYMVLTSTMNVPFASILDMPSDTHPFEPDVPSIAGALPAPEPRAPYRPAAEFDQASSLPNLINSARERDLLSSDSKAPVRFSPATLQLMTDAHRAMSRDTHRLGLAAADLFRRCERMRSELQEQVRKIAEIADRVDAVTGTDEVDGEDDDEEKAPVGKNKIEARMDRCQSKTIELNERVDSLRRKMVRLGGRELSAKERAFGTEVQKLQHSLGPSSDSMPTDDGDGSRTSGALAIRFEAVQSLQQKLVEQANAAAEQATQQQESQNNKTKANGVGNGFRKQRLAQVMALLERETALVEAVEERLRRLQVT